MKKIYLALIALTLGVSAQAQRNIVIESSITKPAIDTNIVTGSITNPIFWLKNVSATVADSLMAGDTVRIVSPLSVVVGSSSISVSSFIMGGSLRKGDSTAVTVTGGIAFDQIETLLTLAGDTIVAKPFTSNKQYNWYFRFANVTAPAKNIPIASATAATATFAKRRIWINKASTSINEVSNAAAAIKTFPNPAANQLSFEYSFTTNEKATASILDVAGRIVLVKEFDATVGNQKVDMDINAVPSGLYLLRINAGEQTATTKFNVQK